MNSTTMREAVSKSERCSPKRVLVQDGQCPRRRRPQALARDARASGPRRESGREPLDDRSSRPHGIRRVDTNSRPACSICVASGGTMRQIAPPSPR